MPDFGLSENHADANTEVVLCLATKTGWVVVKLDGAEIHPVVHPEVNTTTKYTREAGLALVDVESVFVEGRMRNPNHSMGEWTHLCLFSVVLKLDAADQVVKARFNVEGVESIIEV